MSDERRPPERGELWRHYKGGIYRILHLGQLEATCAPVVIYQDVRPHPRSAPVWVRTLADFMSYATPLIEPQHGHTWRFERQECDRG